MAKFNTAQKFGGLFLVVLLAVAIFFFSSQSVLGYSQIDYQNINNPTWNFLISSSNYADEIKIFNAGDSIPNNQDAEFKERLSISLDYDQPKLNVQFNQQTPTTIGCNDLLTPTSLGFKKYTYTSPNNPLYSKTATVKITLGSSEIFNKQIDLGNPQMQEYKQNGIFLEPQFEAYDQNPTLIYRGVALIYDEINQKSYLISEDEYKSILQSIGTPTNIIVGVNILGVTVGYGQTYTLTEYPICPFGGASEARTKILNALQNSQPPAQSIGSNLDYSSRAFSTYTGVLTMKGTGVKEVFTLQIPSKIGDRVVWSQKLVKPRIVIKTSSLDISTASNLNVDICNDASIDGSISVITQNTGAIVVLPETTQVQVSANSCTPISFTLLKQAELFDGKITITATSRENIDVKTINYHTLAGDTVNPIDYCLEYPEKCVQPTKNDSSTCLPFLQKETSKVQGGYTIPYLNWNFGGTESKSCDWDYFPIGIFLIILGIIPLSNAKKGEKNKLALGIMLMFIGAILLVLSFISENALLLYLGGGGIFLLAVGAIIIFVVLKGLIK